MKCIHNLLIAGSLLLSVNVVAQDCVIPMSVVLSEQAIAFPREAEANLQNQLRRAVTQNGIATDDATFTQFGITAKFDELNKEVAPGAPALITRKLGVTLYIVDLYNQKIISSDYFEAVGIGATETKSWINAMGRINGKNKNVRQALAAGKSKIIRYYDQQYPVILKQAKQALSQQRYEEALSLANSIPPCCAGYDEATKFGETAYQQNLNHICQRLLAQAQAVWVAGQDADAAADAAFLISQIDPKSSSYAAGQKLMEEMKKQVRSDIDFEMREKYRDQIALQKQGIDAWRQVGVAYGNGQQPVTTHINWIR